MIAPIKAHLRRLVFFSLVSATTVMALVLLTSVYQADGLTPLEMALLLLYGVLIGWISLSFWAASIGFVIQLRGRDGAAINQQQSNTSGAEPGLTALVMPVYNEDPHRVFAGLAAICDDLLATGKASGFEVFILSDTRDPELWVEEEQRWQALALTYEGRIPVYYRNREQNKGRKVGNLKDFCTRWGGRYEFMIVLDADSLMSGATLVRMRDIMSSQPALGLLQVPPTPVGKESLYARILQFASSAYGPIFTTGLNFWQLGEGNYWGHNAIIRMRAFTDHCGLPSLPGREPFGGEIFSHDFVEAAMLRRNGWQVWLAYDLIGSYEELPPTLIDYAKRDRRWCQGNLQHLSLIFAKGWHPINRLHFVMGIMSYLASPLWLLFLVLTGIDAYVQAQTEPVYFFGASIFPIWPPSFAVEMTTVLVATLTMLFLPKLLALLLMALQPERRRSHGGLWKAGLSVLLETLTSALLAPILMLFQSQFVLAILMRRNTSWVTQQRDDHQTGFKEALATHGWQSLLALVAGWLSYRYVPDFFWWFIPVLLGLVLAIPLSMLLSSRDLGLFTKRLKLFLIPEEIQLPSVLGRLEVELARPDPVALTPGDSRFLRAISDPQLNALHLALLPSTSKMSRRRYHELLGLIYRLLEEGESSLSSGEKRALLSDAETLNELHLLAWVLPGMTADFGRVKL